MRGPNYWSATHSKIVFLKLDLEELGREPTHQIENFLPRLKALMPGLQSHTCAHHQGRSFLEVVEQGTWMGHIVEHIALELQVLAGMSLSYGKTISTKRQGVYYVLFEYQVEDAGRYAAEAAVKIAAALADARAYNLQNDLEVLTRMARREALGPGTKCIVGEAMARGIPCKRLNGNSLMVLGYGNRQKKICATVAGTTSGIGIEIAGDKAETKNILGAAFVPVPEGIVITAEQEVINGVESVGFPLVIKPATGNHGRGITTGIRSMEEAIVAFRTAKTISDRVIMERFITGSDFRILVVNYKFVAAAKRTPARVTGNGVSTIAELIDAINKDVHRGDGHDNILTRITIDESTASIPAKNQLNPDAVLSPGESLGLKHTASISTGGTAEDVTDKVHPCNISMAERIAALVGLDICGIDILAKDISQKLQEDNGAVVGVNAGPGLRMHLEPSKGLSRNIAKPIVDMLFPGDDNGRIPVIAVTGTNGKTTTTRLIAHIAAHAGYSVGFTTTEGINIGGHEVLRGDCTGPASCEAVLFDPTIDLAVLECARGGILRSGLAFDTCDISIVTNVSGDHLGLKDIDTPEEMARVKMVVPLSTKAEGVAILNADDDLVYNMRNGLSCGIALFSMSPTNERVHNHCEAGGTAAIVEDGYLTIVEGKWKSRIERIESIPLSLNGRAESMIKNLLPAALAATLHGIELRHIREALQSFVPSPEITPGRMNIFKFRDYSVLIDYAHNADGLQQLKKFLDRTKASAKVGIIGLAGDRRDQDFREVGALAATMFDEIIIRHDKDLRGRPKEDMTRLFSEGIAAVNSDLPVKVISAETDALRHAMRHAKKDAFITICSEKIYESIDFVKEAHSAEKKEPLAATNATVSAGLE